MKSGSWPPFTIAMSWTTSKPSTINLPKNCVLSWSLPTKVTYRVK